MLRRARGRWGCRVPRRPSPATRVVYRLEAIRRTGTLAPWAVVASLPFAPEIVLPAIRYFTDRVRLRQADSYSFKATFNPTYPVKSHNPYGWVSRWNYGLNQGPI